ncbi:BON domain-containing protein [Anaeromyxobacter sp. Red801]|uniref:BON domain-containing protein n=1 Tax=Anaeromyxobacter sp. Red801 TaxID=3411632 RepID=UPI003BA05E3B
MRTGETVEVVRRRLSGEARLDLGRHPVALAFDDGVLTMEGELGDVGAKKLALERAAAVAGVRHIVDRLRVAPARRMTDAEIRDHLRDLLLEAAELQPVARAGPAPAGGPAPGGPDLRLGSLGASVREGVVTLDGAVPSLAHKRLAGVLAWWIPGVRDVVNGLEVVPPEQDGDDEITDAVRLALEKDPLVDADAIAVSTRGAVVTLRGAVRCEIERAAAERDAWCVFGVDGVRNLVER